MIRVLDVSKMKKRGKQLCRAYEPVLRLKRTGFPEGRLSGQSFTVKTYDSDREVTLRFEAESSSSDMAADFIEACRFIAMADSEAGAFLIYRYYFGRCDDDIVEDMAIGKKKLSRIKEKAYTEIAYLAGVREYAQVQREPDPELMEISPDAEGEQQRRLP